MCCRGVNWNNLCAYTTPRLVKIRDWRLGLTNALLMLAIFVYVVIYAVVIEQRYRLKALDLVGSTRLQLRSPAANFSIGPAQSLFCGNGTATYPGPSSLPFQAYPCRYYDPYDAVDPGLEPGAMFVSTRITESNQTLSNACLYQPVPSCQYVTVSTTTYFIGDVEMMTLLLDHTFSSNQLGTSKSAMGMVGQLQDLNGNVVRASPPAGRGARRVVKPQQCCHTAGEPM